MGQGIYNETNIEDIAKNVLDNVAKNNAPKVSTGQILQEKRKALNIEIADACKALCVKSDDIIAIESDDFDKASSNLYVPGLVRSYAKFLGIEKAIIEEEIKKVSLKSNLSNKFVSFKEGLEITPDKELFFNVAVIAILLFSILLSIYNSYENKDSLISNQSLILELEKINIVNDE